MQDLFETYDVKTEAEWSAKYLTPIRTACRIATEADELTRIISDGDLKCETIEAMLDAREELARLHDVLHSALKLLHGLPSWKHRPRPSARVRNAHFRQTN